MRPHISIAFCQDFIEAKRVAEDLDSRRSLPAVTFEVALIELVTLKREAPEYPEICTAILRWAAAPMSCWPAQHRW